MWLSRAGEKGLMEAQFVLSGLLRNKHSDASMRWLQKAADAGHIEAQYELGRQYEKGRNIERNEQLASRWYSMAAYQGHRGARRKLDNLFRGHQGIGDF